MLVKAIEISIHALLAESDVLVSVVAARGDRFLSTLSLRRATRFDTFWSAYPRFLSTLSLRRATRYSLRRSASNWHFYPRSPCGERPICKRQVIPVKQFLSTLSLRRATILCVVSVQIGRFLSTLSLRRATPSPPRARVLQQFLSTLSLRRATFDTLSALAPEEFLSTLSLRRATYPASITPTASRNFYPRSPCGERLKLFSKRLCDALFLSTLSLRRATSRAETVTAKIGHFYPRSPCGERPPATESAAQTAGFLSTLSLRRATGSIMTILIACEISIHALLAESDNFCICAARRSKPFLSTLSLRRATDFSPFGPMTRQYFYPRSPCGERPNTSPGAKSRTPISIHALLAESDIFADVVSVQYRGISIHALLAESDMVPSSMYTRRKRFLSTLSLRRATAFQKLMAALLQFLSTLSLRRATADG